MSFEVDWCWCERDHTLQDQNFECHFPLSYGSSRSSLKLCEVSDWAPSCHPPPGGRNPRPFSFAWAVLLGTDHSKSAHLGQAAQHRAKTLSFFFLLFFLNLTHIAVRGGGGCIWEEHAAVSLPADFQQASGARVTSRKHSH